MLVICSTCLSQDRFLKVLSSMDEVATLEWVYDFLSPNSMLCWECVADLTRIHRFRRRAREAQDALQMTMRLGLNQAPTLFSLSTLTTVTSPQLYQEECVHIKTEIELDTFQTYYQSLEIDSVEPSFEHELNDIGSDLMINTDLPKIETELTNIDDIVPGLLCDDDNKSNLNSHSDSESESPFINRPPTLDQNSREYEDLIQEDHIYTDEVSNELNDSDNVVTAATTDTILVKKEIKCTTDVKTCKTETKKMKRDEAALLVGMVGAECRLELRDAAAELLCTRCDSPRWFLSPHRLREHTRAVHATDPAPTHTAQHTHTTRTQAVRPDRHLSAVPLGEKPYPEPTTVCNICGKTFPCRSALKNHMLSHAGIKPFACDMCDMKFVGKGSLSRHIIKGNHRREKYLSVVRLGRCSKPKTVCNICGKTFPCRSALKKHMLSHTGMKPFACNICDGKFDGKLHLSRHIKYVHSGEKMFQCTSCDKRYCSKINLTDHMMSVHLNEKPFPCNICDKAFPRNCVLDKHIKRVHNTKRPITYLCDLCHACYYSRRGIEKHIMLSHKNGMLLDSSKKLFVCDLCDLKFTMKQRLSQHIENVHLLVKKSFSCGICKKAFSRRDTLVSHVKLHNPIKPAHTTQQMLSCDTQTALRSNVSLVELAEFLKPHTVCKKQHNGEKPYSCTSCDKRYVQKVQLINHIKIFHNGEKPYSCTSCDKRFSTNQNLTFHYQRVHQLRERERQIFVCDSCGNQLSSKASLTHHKSVYHGEKPYSCTSCDKQYVQKVQLTNHIKIFHNGEKPYSCTSCDKRYAQKGHLTYHVKSVHHGEKSYPCTSCDKQYRTEAHLTDHFQRVHQRSEKRNACDWCGKLYSEKSTLTHHIKSVHHGVKAYSCSSCDKRYSNKHNLTYHIKSVHNGEKPYSCTSCGKRYSTKQNLTFHIQRVHQLQVRERERPIFECDLCGNKYSSKASLIYHMKGVHLGEKSFSCKICDKQFVMQQTLNKHMDSAHNPKKLNFSCDICEASYGSRQLLKIHLMTRHKDSMLLNTGIKLFACDNCDLKFTWKSSLTRHVESIHNIGKKYFSCNICNKQFVCQKTLSRHNVNGVHIKQRANFSCNLCEASYSSRQDLKKHLMTSHKMLVNTGTVTE